MKFLATLLLVSLQSYSFAAEGFSTVDALINSGKYPQAKQELNTVLAKTPQDFEALWRLSRLQNFEADEIKEESKKEAGYQLAFQTADLAIKANPGQAAGYLRKASASGKIALFKGILQAREFVGMVKENSEKAISLGNGGPEIQAWSHYVLGRAHLKLSATPAVIRKPLGLGWGTLAKAEEHILKASTLKPDSALIWLEVARLRKSQKNKGSFDQAMQKVKQLPVLEPTDKQAKEEMASLEF
jgi:tetratricopeptide (TPR) repeat protein